MVLVNTMSAFTHGIMLTHGGKCLFPFCTIFFPFFFVHFSLASLLSFYYVFSSLCSSFINFSLSSYSSLHACFSLHSCFSLLSPCYILLIFLTTLPHHFSYYSLFICSKVWWHPLQFWCLLVVFESTM